MSNAPLPVIVGITGHRNICPKDFVDLENQIVTRLQHLKKTNPDSTVIVLSSLAQGADRIGACAAKKAGCQLHIPLPMALAAYKKDFNDSSEKEFDTLLSLADKVYVVEPLEPLPNGTPARGFFYRQAGYHIASNVQILIALWDGKRTLFSEGGGTYETICFMRDKGGVVDTIKVRRCADPIAVSSATFP